MGFNETTQQFDIFIIPDTVSAPNIQYNKQNINQKVITALQLAKKLQGTFLSHQKLTTEGLKKFCLV